MPRVNQLGQPIGDPLPEDWTSPPRPARRDLEGPRTLVQPLDLARHGADLWEADRHDDSGAGWTYMGSGPFERVEDFRDWVAAACRSEDQLFYAFLDRSSGKAIGWGSYLRINPGDGSIEVGSIRFSPLLQRTAMATEVMHVMMRYAFQLGYRRYEWKCDSLNAPSRRAAERLGFTYEGIFRQATHYKGRNRDTAWYAILDRDWPAIEAAHLAWLSPENFDQAGRQRRSLSAFISA